MRLAKYTIMPKSSSLRESIIVPALSRLKPSRIKSSDIEMNPCGWLMMDRKIQDPLLSVRLGLLEAPNP
jgi:hypothetical protein